MCASSGEAAFSKVVLLSGDRHMDRQGKARACTQASCFGHSRKWPVLCACPLAADKRILRSQLLSAQMGLLQMGLRRR